jgi:hypothetical protein
MRANTTNFEGDEVERETSGIPSVSPEAGSGSRCHLAWCWEASRGTDRTRRIAAVTAARPGRHRFNHWGTLRSWKVCGYQAGKHQTGASFALRGYVHGSCP